MLKLDMSFKLYNIILGFIIILFSVSSIHLSADNTGTIIFPDEYSELDDEDIFQAPLRDRYTQPILDKAQAEYEAALEYISKKDTVSAAYHFERAIARLNPLASHPDIENNTEYIELFQIIIDDYEAFVRSTEYIDENTPFYMIQELYFEDEDGNETVILGEDYTTPKSIAFEPGYVPPPDSMVIPLPDNKYVAKNIEFYTKAKVGQLNLKGNFERSSKWFPMFKRYAKEVGVPEEVIYIPVIESSLKSNAVSHASAVGMWQFMRSTGAMYGLNNPSSIWVDERRDPEKATKAAMQHLLDLYLAFGDWHLAFAAYNCGQGCVSRGIKRANLKKEEANFDNIRSKLPKETRHYVPRYIAVVKMFSTPKKYGIDINEFEFEKEYAYETFHLDTAVSLYGLAKCADISEDELKALNPELIKSCTPPEGYDLKIPSGTKGLFSLKYAELPQIDKEPFHKHVIGRRETVTKLSNKYGISTKDILVLNGLKSKKARLKKGDTLLIPVDPRKWEVAVDSPDDLPITPDKEETKEYVTHTVVEGETLYGIAKKYNLNPAVLQEMNSFNPDEQVLKPGDELIIAQRDLTPEEVKAKQTKKKNTPSKTGKVIKHKVKKGESLNSIAIKYMTSVDDIQEENGLDNYKIYTGQILKIVSTKKYEKEQADIKRRNAPRRNKHGDIVHKVRRGENLGYIARKYRTTVAKIRELNPNDVSGDNIKAGATLQITGPKRVAKKTSKPTKVQKTPADGYYTVKSGENFSTIARKFGISASDLEKLNPGVRPERLQIGQKIRVK
jgi:membrane-bound lytic murein transglycosylase D